jgi:hypothetical protein
VFFGCFASHFSLETNWISPHMSISVMLYCIYYLILNLSSIVTWMEMVGIYVYLELFFSFCFAMCMSFYIDLLCFFYKI